MHALLICLFFHWFETKIALSMAPISSSPSSSLLSSYENLHSPSPKLRCSCGVQQALSLLCTDCFFFPLSFFCDNAECAAEDGCSKTHTAITRGGNPSKRTSTIAIACSVNEVHVHNRISWMRDRPTLTLIFLCDSV